MFIGFLPVKIRFFIGMIAIMVKMDRTIIFAVRKSPVLGDLKGL